MSAPPITMDVRRVGEKTAVVDIKGEVTAACEPVLMSAYEAAGGSATSRLVLNFAGLEYMNSGGIGMLVTLLVRANRQHQQLAAYGLSEHYREIFELTRLDEAITIYDSEESALTASLGEGPSHDGNRVMTETAGPDEVASTEQIGLSAREAASLPPRDAASWAKKVDRLQVDPRDGVRGTNVAGRRLTGPVQGFGKMWQKTYRMDAGPQIPPRQAIATWREHFPEFWPKGNRFAGALTGINPGDVALLDLAIGGGVKLSTGVFVLYADAESFTLMTPQGHMFAGWITFSAEREGETTIVQAQVLMRANDPLYEIAMTLGGHRKEDKFWVATLTALGQRLGIQDPTVDTRSTCVDSSRQWRHSRNVCHNSMVRSVLQTLAAPVTGLGRLMRGSKRGMKSQPNG